VRPSHARPAWSSRRAAIIRSPASCHSDAASTGSSPACSIDAGALARQRRAVRWQEAAQHRLAGERAHEANAVRAGPVGHEQAALDRHAQRVEDRRRGLGGDGRQQPPVDGAAQHGGGVDDGADGGLEGGQALVHHARE